MQIGRKLATIAATIGIALASVTLGLAGTVATAGTAAAAPATVQSCNWIYIGNAGSIHIGGQYVGQVVQLYDNCGTAAAHFQWDETYRQTHYNLVNVVMKASNGTVGYSWSGYTSTKDVWAYVDIHSTSPDVWEAQATVSGCTATGTMHDYSNGGTWWGPSSPWC